MATILAQNALTTLERVKADLGVTVSTNDDKISRAINSASGLIERYCGRTFWRDTAIVEKIPGYGWTEMRVSRRPLNLITSIVYNGSSTVDSGDYDISDAGAGLIEKTGGWEWTAYRVRDISRGILPGTERRLFAVTYDGGWYTPGQSRAQGTVAFTGQPTAEDTMVLNLTTITAKASGAITDQFDIGGSVRDTCDNLVTAINAGSELANVRAWRVELTVVVEWFEEGTVGSSIVFTEALDNATIDGAGLLGGTQAGQTRGLPWDLEDVCAELSRALYLAKTRDPSVSNERLLSWSASYNVITQGGRMPASITRVLDLYKVLTL